MGRTCLEFLSTLASPMELHLTFPPGGSLIPKHSWAEMTRNSACVLGQFSQDGTYLVSQTEW